eukprot:5718415-Amphidinium_carterae.1
MNELKDNFNRSVIENGGMVIKQLEIHAWPLEPFCLVPKLLRSNCIKHLIPANGPPHPLSEKGVQADRSKLTRLCLSKVRHQQFRYSPDVQLGSQNLSIPTKQKEQVPLAICTTLLFLVTIPVSHVMSNALQELT